MILRADTERRIMRLRDVARIELGALAYDQVCTLDAQAVGRAVDLPAARARTPWIRPRASATRWTS